MDVAGISMLASQSQIRTDASMAVLKKVMEVSQEQLAKMLEMSVEPHLGANVDIRI